MTYAISALIVVLLSAQLLVSGDRTKLVLLGWLAVLRPRIPGLPVSVVSVGAVVASVFSKSMWKALLSRRQVLPLLLMLVAQCFSLAYSPDRAEGVRRVLQLCSFLVMIGLSLSALDDGTVVLLKAGRALSPLVLLESVSTVLFRLFPEIEREYLTSRLASYFLGEEGAAVYSGAPNNVAYTFKAGGLFFVSGNQASLFLGICALLFGFAFLIDRRVWDLACLAFGIGGVVATGSKTGLVLMMLVPSIVFLVFSIRRRSSGGRGFALIICLMVMLLVAVTFALGHIADALSGSVDEYSGRVDDADETLGMRLRIWSSGVWLFARSPIFGLGFGGWTESFSKAPMAYTFTREFPPHNFLIAAWADAGVLNLVAVVWFVVATLVMGFAAVVKGSEHSASHSEGLVAACALGVVVWVFAHGMLDNTDVWGSAHCLGVLAPAVATIWCSGSLPGTSRLKEVGSGV